MRSLAARPDEAAKQLYEAAAAIGQQDGTDSMRLAHIALAISKLGAAGLGEPMAFDTQMTERLAQLILGCVQTLIATAPGRQSVDFQSPKAGERTVVRLVEHATAEALDLLRAVMRADIAVSMPARSRAGSLTQTLLQLRTNILGPGPDEALSIAPAPVQAAQIPCVASSSGPSTFDSTALTALSTFDHFLGAGASDGDEPLEAWGALPSVEDIMRQVDSRRPATGSHVDRGCTGQCNQAR